MFRSQHSTAVDDKRRDSTPDPFSRARWRLPLLCALRASSSSLRVAHTRPGSFPEARSTRPVAGGRRPAPGRSRAGDHAIQPQEAPRRGRTREPDSSAPRPRACCAVADTACLHFLFQALRLAASSLLVRHWPRAAARARAHTRTRVTHQAAGHGFPSVRPAFSRLHNTRDRPAF